MNKIRMIKKSLPLVLIACFLFISMTGCSAQSEKTTLLRIIRMKPVQKFYRNRILL